MKGGSGHPLRNLGEWEGYALPPGHVRLASHQSLGTTTKCCQTLVGWVAVEAPLLFLLKMKENAKKTQLAKSDDGM
jgi:hypothetical protein